MARLLASIAASEYPLDRVEVVVADNADDLDTRHICDSYRDRLDITYLVETTKGKNSALNTALPLARGELLLFTDDDVAVAPRWLAEMAAAASRWPKHQLFGGRVLPNWPSECPMHLRQPQYLGMCFSVLDRNSEEGPDPAFSPFGPNLAVRRSLFDAGARFNMHIGPNGASYIMGSETEFITRLKAAGHVPVYVPGSMVLHTIRPEQFTERWLRGRAFRYGRLVEVRLQRDGRAHAGHSVHLLRPMLHNVAGVVLASMLGRRQARFDHLMELAIKYGRYYQSRQPPLESGETSPPSMPGASRQVLSA